MASVLTLLSISDGGIATLSDQTYWRITPVALVQARSWGSGCPVSVEVAPRGSMWSNRLVNQLSGESVAVVMAAGMMRR